MNHASESKKFYGIWGELRHVCLKEYHPEKLQRMVEEGTLDAHLKEIQEIYSERYQTICDRLMDDFLAKEGRGSYEDYAGYVTASASQAREIITNEIYEL